MEATGELLFLLSSSDRLKILSILQKDRMKLSQVAAKLSSTVQETSRQLQRMEAAGLVEKDSKGYYGPSTYCLLVLRLLPALEFLVERREFLRGHELTSLPTEFVERLGELRRAEMGCTLGEILDHFEEVLDESKEYVALMADHVLLVDSVARRILRGDDVRMRIIVPRGVISAEDYDDFSKEMRGKIELGIVEKVGAGVALNERLAGVVFADRAGKIDFSSGLRSEDAAFHHWCQDLFDYYWREANKVI